MCDSKSVHLRVSAGFQVPFDIEYMNNSDMEFILKAGHAAWEFSKCEIDKIETLNEKISDIATKNEVLEAENRKFKAALGAMDTIVNSKLVIEIRNDDKWLREFLRKHSIPSQRKREDNLEKIKNWAVVKGLELKIV
jgi:hypothetical protein